MQSIVSFEIAHWFELFGQLDQNRFSSVSVELSLWLTNQMNSCRALTTVCCKMFVSLFADFTEKHKPYVSQYRGLRVAYDGVGKQESCAVAGRPALQVYIMVPLVPVAII